MKYVLIYTLVFLSVSCGTSKVDNKNTYEGTLNVQGITSYQYGTHILETNSGFYALKSDTIILDDFVDEIVMVEAETINGYPVDGGPVYLNVLSIEVKE